MRLYFPVKMKTKRESYCQIFISLVFSWKHQCKKWTSYWNFWKHQSKPESFGNINVKNESLGNIKINNEV